MQKYNKIEIENDEEFSSEIQRLSRSLNLCNYNKNIDAFDLKLKEFEKKSLNQTFFDQEEYLNLADTIIDAVKNQIDDLNTLQVCLDLSRLHCGVFRLYESKGIVSKMIPFVANIPFEYTESNRDSIKDYLYSFYYWKVIQSLDKDNDDDAIISLFKNNKFLNSKEGSSVRETVLRSVISNNKYKKCPYNVNILEKLLL